VPRVEQSSSCFAVPPQRRPQPPADVLMPVDRTRDFVAISARSEREPVEFFVTAPTSALKCAWVNGERAD
jgi:hypothetical protein